MALAVKGLDLHHLPGHYSANGPPQMKRVGQPYDSLDKAPTERLSHPLILVCPIRPRGGPVGSAGWRAPNRRHAAG
jgi:hypothetical protein